MRAGKEGTTVFGLEFRALRQLALPLMASQVGLMLLGVVETLIVGRAGTTALAAVSLGNVWAMGTVFVAMGVVMGADPLFSQAYGAKDTRLAALTFQRGLILAVFLGLPIAVFWLFTRSTLIFFGQDPGLAGLAQTFVLVQAPTAFCTLIFLIARQYLAGRGVVGPSLWVIFIVNLINIGMTYWMVFGGMGVPALGVLGAGIAGGVVRVLLAGLLLALIFVAGFHRFAWIPWGRHSFDIHPIARIAWLGLPIGLQMGLEVWAFQIATLMAGKQGEISLGAQSIVLNLSSLSFMFPLGIATAASIRVGNFVGAGDGVAARRAAYVALLSGAGVMTFFGGIFFFFRWQLPRVYGAEPAVIALCADVLPIVAAFQILDGTQVVAAGVLRGLGRTRPAAYFNLGGYYFFALPLAYFLGVERGWGLRGIWLGLAGGLLFVAVCLLLLLSRGKTFQVHRLEI